MGLGGALRASRKLRKLSQTDLADLAGVCRSAVVALEQSKGRLSTLLSVLPHSPLRFEGLPDATSLADRVKVARVERGLSIPEAAALSGVAANTIRAIETGHGNVSAFVKVSAALVADFHVLPRKPNKPMLWRTVAGRMKRDRDPFDYFATPVPITRLLLENVSFDRHGTVLEPCVGQARALEFALKEAGFTSITTYDVLAVGDERRDFFEVTEEFEYVVTNPPFREHRRFIAQAKLLARRKVALLLPINYLTGAGRLAEIWSDQAFPLAEVLILNRGIDFLGDPFAEQVASSQMYCAWFVWDRSHVGEARMRWLDNHAVVGRKAA